MSCSKIILRCFAFALSAFSLPRVVALDFAEESDILGGRNLPQPIPLLLSRKMGDQAIVRRGVALLRNRGTEDPFLALLVP